MNEPPPLVRAFPTTIKTVTVADTGQRILTGRLVPYNTVADVMDRKPDGQPDIYREGFRRGSFSKQAMTREPGVLQRIGLIHKHDGGLGYLGPFVALREQSDGLWGDVRIIPSKADDVQALLDSGIQELSIEFRLPGGMRSSDHTSVDDDGVRWRVKAHLDQVALEAKGAYSSAQVIQYRQQVEAEQKERAEAEAARQAEENERLEREKAEREAAEEAKRREEQAKADAEERRRRFEDMVERLDDALGKQEQLKDYGMTHSQIRTRRP